MNFVKIYTWTLNECKPTAQHEFRDHGIIYGGGLGMVVNRPAIIIYTREPDKDLLREVCAGIEEEGVLYQVQSHDGELDDLAFEAAKESMLGAGIGMEGRRIAMQMQRLPRGRNVFELNCPMFWQCRNLGANSARAIKKMPFKPVYSENGVGKDC